MKMKVESIFPQAVAATAKLVDRFAIEAASSGATPDEASALVASLPPSLRRAMCFDDKLSGIWKYEFGEALYLPRIDQLLWGTIWIPVRWLVVGMRCALARISVEKKLDDWLRRLDDPVKHRETLAEMMPMARCAATVEVDFEVVGLGSGNRTVDWVFSNDGEGSVIMDVKQRIADLIHAMDRDLDRGIAPDPTHDHALVFRSVQKKFLDADPNVRLQGAWVATDIQQETDELLAAFEGLDAAKVHFAVLGDFEPGVKILVRRERDLKRLVRLLGVDFRRDLTRDFH